MLSIQTLLRLADEYQRATDVSASTVSWRVFGDTKKLTAIRAGKDIQVSRYEKALRWFSENWPADAVWPADIPRPVPAEGAAA